MCKGEGVGGVNTKEFEKAIDDIAAMRGFERIANFNHGMRMPQGAKDFPDRVYLAEDRTAIVVIEVKWGEDKLSKGQYEMGIKLLSFAKNVKAFRYIVGHTLEDASYVFGPDYDPGKVEVK
jgi:hypothetical protein